MKRTGLFLISIFLITLFLSFQPATAQEKSKEDQEKEYKIQQAIDEQKKAMLEQKKAQEQALINLQKSQDELENRLKDINVEVILDDSDKVNQDVRTRVKRINSRYHVNEPFVFTPGVEPPYWVGSFDSDKESTTWEFSRRVKEKSMKSEYSFDVEKTANTVVMSVNGDCKAGDIRVKIIMPSGKTYSDIVIDEFGNLNWRKSFTISETENQDKAGAWKFQITSNKATGYFKISLQAY
jgi:hypothetical protein